jgi:hypothetical protein
MKHYCLPIFAGLAALLASAAAATEQMPANDLREFHIGEPVASLPKSGYVDLTCAAAAGTALASWSDYTRCPIDARGLHAVSFRYDGSANPMARISEDAQQTRVAGQPVLLQLLIDDKAELAGIRIATDPAARLHARRGAYLFGQQAKARYGAAGWQCTEAPPTATEQPIGPSFVKEHCEKRANGRHYIIDRDLHRDPTLDLRQFVSASTVVILKDDIAR